MTQTRVRRSPKNSAENEELSEAVSHLLEECRIVLPGVQALFGFQLIAVFNQRFAAIPVIDQRTHLAATALSAICAALVMTPAAYHRSIRTVSQRFLDLSTRLIQASLCALAVAIAIDFYVVAHLVVGDWKMSATLAAVLGLILTALWFIFPWRQSQPGK